MSIDKYIPTAPELVKEGLIVLGGILIAALILSKAPRLKKLVEDNSLTVKDSNGNIFWS